MNNGGAILKKAGFINIYYGDYWSTKKGASDSDYFNKFGNFLLNSPHMEIWKEYGCGKGKFLGSASVGTEGKLILRIVDREIQRLVEKQISSGKVQKEDGQTVYTVFLPPGVELRTDDGSSSLDGLGGYHGSYMGPRGKPVYYAAIAYAAKDNGINFDGKPRDNVTIAVSHEWTEAVTDPDVGRDELGWYDDRYGEIGDIPITMGMPLASVYERLGGYAIQKEWSNADKRAEVVRSVR